MEHVHTTGETELTSFVRGELQCRPGKGCQCLASLKIGKDYPGATVTSFLAVEYQTKWDIFLDPDYVGRITALNGDGYLLYVSFNLGCLGLLGPEEKPD